MYEISMKALAVLFLAAMGYGLACQILKFWQKVRPRRPLARRPAPALFAAKPAEPKPAPKPKVREYGLRLRVDGMNLEWTFPSPEARYWFNIGFREGAEYELEALKRKGWINQDAYVEFSRLKAPQSRRCTNSAPGRT